MITLFQSKPSVVQDTITREYQLDILCYYLHTNTNFMVTMAISKIIHKTIQFFSICSKISTFIVWNKNVVGRSQQVLYLIIIIILYQHSNNIKKEVNRNRKIVNSWLFFLKLFILDKKICGFKGNLSIVP